MIYQDRLYEKIEIIEPVVLELIKASSLQRLKEIDQAGYFEPYFPGTTRSRFEHSLGVFALLKNYNAPLEEQVAGLIHDVSHTVFSHCGDYTLDTGSEKEHSHQDNIFEEFVKNSEIPLILKKYDLDVDYILNEDNFPLLEKSLPDLCADRIDYSLRTAKVFGEINREELEHFLSNLLVQNNSWIFSNFGAAKKYANLFLKLNSLYYAGLHSAIMFRTVGDCLRYALQKNYLTENDIYTTDQQVLQKIRENLDKDKELRLLFARMNNDIKFENNPNDYNTHVFCKSRAVNPLCIEQGEIKRISEIDEKWSEILKKESIPKEYFIKFER